MAKYGLAAALLGLYIAGSAWIVGRVGESYRKGLVQKHSAPQRAAGRPNSLEEAIRPTNGNSPSHSEPLRIARAEGDQSRPRNSVPESPIALSGLDQKNVFGTGSGQTAPRGVTPPISIPSVPDDAWSTKEMTRVWDINALNVDDEIRLGGALNEMILRIYKKHTDDPSLLERVINVSDPLRRTVIRKEIPYRFTILDTNVVNIFSHPGGYVYVTKGLMDKIDPQKDGMLQFAIGVEMAHVDLQHSIKLLQLPEIKNHRNGTLQCFSMWIIPSGYPSFQDFEADRWISTRMTDLQRTPLEQCAYLRMLKTHAEANGFGSERGMPKDFPSDSYPIDNHIRAHVSPRERLAKLRALLVPTAKPNK